MKKPNILRNHKRCTISAIEGKGVRGGWKDLESRGNSFPFEVSALGTKVYRLCDTLNFHIPPMSHSCIISSTSYTQFLIFFFCLPGSFYQIYSVEKCFLPTWDLLHLISLDIIRFGIWYKTVVGSKYCWDYLERRVWEWGEVGNHPLELSISLHEGRGCWS